MTWAGVSSMRTPGIGELPSGVDYGNPRGSDDHLRQPSAIAGVLAVGLVLLGGRWSSYIGVNPIFLTDILLGAAILHLLLTSAIKPGIIRQSPKEAVFSPAVLMVLTAWVLLRMMFSAQFSLEWVRDAVPYLYIGAAGILGWVAAKRSSPVTRNTTVRIIVWALVLHQIWFLTSTVLYPPLPSLMPVIAPAQGLHLFQPRNDYDAALAGVLAALILRRLLSGGKRPFWLIVAFFACWASILAATSRAGLLAAVVACALALIVATSGGANRQRNKRLIVVSLAPLVVALVMLSLPGTELGTRLIGTFSADPSSQLANGAAGTTRARQDAWGALLTWTAEEPPRLFFGAGFGINIMTESGAAGLLIGDNIEGEAVPRSPHNYWIGTLARLGLFGTGLIAFGVIRHIYLVARSRHALRSDSLLFIVSLIPLALLPPATLGVILESPFGAVPFWWCVGVMLGLSRRKSSAEPSLGSIQRFGLP
jgi:O-antigen ligase